jgi:hypothetical protein
MKLPVLGVLPRERKFSQNHFLAMTVAELSKKNTNTKRGVGKSQVVLPMDHVPS